MNQQALAHSRLWDAVVGFMFLFAHMQKKLSQNSSQLDLLLMLLDLQTEMVILMLSMLEGNVMNGTIGKQMVDTLVESAANVEMILKFFDIFLKLKDFTSSSTFQVNILIMMIGSRIFFIDFYFIRKMTNEIPVGYMQMILKRLWSSKKFTAMKILLF